MPEKQKSRRPSVLDALVWCAGGSPHKEAKAYVKDRMKDKERRRQDPPSSSSPTNHRRRSHIINPPELSRDTSYNTAQSRPRRHSTLPMPMPEPITPPQRTRAHHDSPRRPPPPEKPLPERPLPPPPPRSRRGSTTTVPPPEQPEVRAKYLYGALPPDPIQTIPHRPRPRPQPTPALVPPHLRPRASEYGEMSPYASDPDPVPVSTPPAQVQVQSSSSSPYSPHPAPYLNSSPLAGAARPPSQYGGEVWSSSVHSADSPRTSVEKGFSACETVVGSPASAGRNMARDNNNDRVNNAGNNSGGNNDNNNGRRPDPMEGFRRRFEFQSRSDLAGVSVRDDRPQPQPSFPPPPPGPFLRGFPDNGWRDIGRDQGRDRDRGRPDPTTPTPVRRRASVSHDRPVPGGPERPVLRSDDRRDDRGDESRGHSSRHERHERHERRGSVSHHERREPSSREHRSREHRSREHRTREPSSREHNTRNRERRNSVSVEQDNCPPGPADAPVDRSRRSSVSHDRGQPLGRERRHLGGYGGLEGAGTGYGGLEQAGMGSGHGGLGGPSGGYGGLGSSGGYGGLGNVSTEREQGDSERRRRKRSSMYPPNSSRRV